MRSRGASFGKDGCARNAILTGHASVSTIIAIKPTIILSSSAARRAGDTDTGSFSIALKCACEQLKTNLFSKLLAGMDNTFLSVLFRKSPRYPARAITGLFIKPPIRYFVRLQWVTKTREALGLSGSIGPSSSSSTYLFGSGLV